MNRRLAALGALGLLAAGVIGLVATAGDDQPEPVTSPGTADASVDPTPTGTGDGADRDEDAGDGSTVVADETDATAQSGVGDASANSAVEAVPLRYDPALVPELPDRGPHPPLVGLDGWLQSDIESIEELRGKVVAVQFWTFGCHNCQATKPHMAALYEKYGGDDFEIIGVHAPEFDFERDPDRIAEAAAEQNVTWPIALDTEKETFRSWQTGRRFWPRIYLIDRDGDIRYDKIGEGRYDEIDAAVGALIDEPFDAELADELEEWVERNPDLDSDPM
ncbi:MAG: redoxin domain-containing protein [Actinomycetota bacterium]